MRKILLFLFIFIFISSVSAVTWDNIAYWDMRNHSGAITDLSGNGFNLTVTGVCDNDGILGFGLKQNANCVANQSTKPMSLALGTGNNTISFWMREYASTEGANKYVIDFGTTETGGLGAKGAVILKNITNAVEGWGNFFGTNDTLLSSENQNGSLNTWTFYVQVRDGDRVRLYKNGVLQSQITGYSQNMSPSKPYIQFFKRQANGVLYNGSLSEVGVWARNISVAEIIEMYNAGNGLPFGTASAAADINVVLNSPANNFVSSSNSILFNSSATTTSLNLTNATIYVWNSTGGLFNRTTTTRTGISNTTTWNITNFINGQYLWNARWCGANSTFTLCEFAGSNQSFELGAEITSEDYNASAYETSRQNFRITLSLLSGIELSLAQLVYNGTNYTVSDITSNGSTRILSRTIDLPVNPNPFGNVTNSFFWRFVFSNSQQTVQTTSVRTQEVGFINFQICNLTYSTEALNFTLYDEIAQTNLIVNSTRASTFLSSWQYWVGTGTIYKNYSYQLLSSPTAANYSFCIMPYAPTTHTFKVSSDIEYSALTFRENQYHLRNATLTNIVSNINLYLINEDEATKFFLTFKRGTIAIQDAIVTVQKYFVGLGQFITTSILLTDEEGEAVMWQDLDANYRYSIVVNGTLIGVVEKSSICSTAPCTLFLSIDTASADPFDPYYDQYAQNVVSTLRFNRTSGIVTYDFIDTTGLANYFRLEVRRSQYNQTGSIICDTQLFSPAGSLSCNVSSYSGEFVAKGYISRSPELLDKVLNFLNDDDVIENLGMTGVFLIMAVIILIVFAGAVVTKGSPSGVLFSLAIGILIVKLVGLFPFTWTVVAVIEFLIGLMIWKVKV